MRVCTRLEAQHADGRIAWAPLLLFGRSAGGGSSGAVLLLGRIISLRLCGRGWRGRADHLRHALVGRHALDRQRRRRRLTGAAAAGRLFWLQLAPEGGRRVEEAYSRARRVASSRVATAGAGAGAGAGGAGGSRRCCSAGSRRRGGRDHSTRSSSIDTGGGRGCRRRGRIARLAADGVDVKV